MLSLHSFRRSPANLFQVMKNAAPWRSSKHFRFDTDLRQTTFWLLTDLLQGESIFPDMVWDEFEHILRAWSVLKSLRVQLETVSRRLREYCVVSEIEFEDGGTVSSYSAQKRLLAKMGESPNIELKSVLSCC